MLGTLRKKALSLLPADGLPSRQWPANVTSRALRRCRLALEPLERRLMLDAGPLVISEFMAVNDDFLADADGDFSDWVELHNRGDDPVELQGWHLTDDAADPAKWRFPDVTLEADGYLLIFASDKDRDDPTRPLHTNFKLRGDGEYLALVGPDGTTVEHAFAPEYPPQVADASFGLSPDTSTQGYFAEPTPAAANTTEPIDDPTRHVLITEIMYHPPSHNSLEEYLELSNQGDEPVDLAGWQFSDGVDFTFPDTLIEPGEYLVVAADVATFQSTYFVAEGTTVVGSWTGQLSDRGERIELIDDAGVRIDRVRYADQGDWGVRERRPEDRYGHEGWIWTGEHDGFGKSLEVINLAATNRYGQNWAASVALSGTPGKPNSVAAADVAPVVLDVTHTPAIPRSTDPVTVTARLIDEESTGLSAAVQFRADGTPDFIALSMRDDGQSGDGEAGDGVYGVQLPAFPDGTVVEFYVEATDTNGRVRSWPAASQPSGVQLTNLLYQVDDTFDPDAVWVPGSQPVYYLIMTEAERAELAAIGDNSGGDRESNAEMNATFISVDGTGSEVRYNVGVRNRGGTTRSGQSNNYRVNFVHERPWEDATKININFNYSYSQVIGSLMYRMAGLAAEEAKPVQVRVNGENRAVTGGRMYGSYAALEAFDADYAANHFPDDPNGNLYQCRDDERTGEHAEIRYEGDDPDAYRTTYFKQTNQEEDDWSDLIHMTYVLNNTPAEDFLEAVGEVIDIDQWVRFLAVDSLVGNREGGLNTGKGDDFALYRGVDDPRFLLMTHDLDTVMGQGASPQPNRGLFHFTGVRGLNSLLSRPEVVARYYAAYLELFETVYNSETLDPVLDQAVGGWIPQSRIDVAKQFIVDRTAGVLAQIPQDFTINSTLPRVGEYLRSSSAAAAFRGEAPAASARSVLVAGQPADWNQRTGEWSIGSQTGGHAATLIEQGAVWKYLDDGSDQPAAWREPAFDDLAWGSGPAQLGYGDNDEATVVGYGDNAGNKHMTTYFRHTFNVPGASNLIGMTLRLLRDDGAVVYLNGQEILRDNMPEGEIDYMTQANEMITGGNEDTFYEFDVDPDLLVDGENVLAVELHQRVATSNDISFDLELEAVEWGVVDGVPLKPGVNRVRVESFDGPDGTGNLVEEGFVDVLYDPAGMPEVQQLGVVVRDSYMPGVPILVRAEAIDQLGNVDRGLWDAVVTLSTDSPDVTLSADQITLYNGLGSTLITPTGSGDFTLTARLGNSEVSSTLVSLEGAPLSEVSGTLAGDETTWSDVVHVTGDLLVPSGHTLTIQPGTLVLVDGVASGEDGTDVDVEGAVQSLGTAADPVTFTAFDPTMPWGEIHHNDAQPSLYQYTNFTRAGNSPRGGHTNSGPVFRPASSTITFDHASITDAAGKIMQATGSDLTFRNSHLARAIMGPEVASTALLFEDNWITEMFGPDDDDGLYIHGQQAGQDVTLRGGVIAHGDDDALDTLRATVTVEDYIFRDFADKGMSIYGGEVTLSEVLSVGNGIGISAKERGTASGTVHIDRATIVGNGIGVEVNDKYDSPDAVIEYYVTNSIIWDNTTPIRTDYDPANIHIDYSNVGEVWPGTDNLSQDPLFTAMAAHDYSLQAGSPSIDAGDPASAADADGTRADQGFFVQTAGAAVDTRVIPAGTITQDTVLSPSFGPYEVTGEVVVDAGATLTVMPGTTVFFAAGARLTVHGQLLAEGTEQEPIWLTRVPGGGTWDGVQLLGTMQDNRITHATVEYGRTNDGMIGVEDSNLLIDHVTLGHTDLRRIRTIDSSLIVRNSTFTDIFGPGEPPSTNNMSEHIWGRTKKDGGHFIIENNVFGTDKGHNDAIDVDGGTRPEPVMQILDNLFLGGGDDALDLEGDAHIEGNLFMHFRRDQWNTGLGNSNAISAGGGHDFVMVRNVFYDVGHVAQIKSGSFMTFENNTVVGADNAALYFLRPGGTVYGRGAHVEGNIFYDTPQVFGDLTEAIDLTLNRSIVPADVVSMGVGNLDLDPRVIDPAGGDFGLGAGSAAFGAGLGGLDMGAMVSAGASISGEPRSVTGETDATLTVDGPGITHYRYRVNDGPWSEATAVDVPVLLADLADGDYTVAAIGLNSAAVWQDEAHATASRTWTVDTSLTGVEISEVLAVNSAAVDRDGSFPDLIELVNYGASPMDLAGMSISDDADDPTRFIFPAGTVMQPGEYLVLCADDEVALPGLHLGFALDGTGEGVFLFDTAANGGALVDSVQFGLQLPDLSIGRVGSARDWSLTQPTFAAANVVQRTGDPAMLQINEWLADAEILFTDDLIELSNADPLPVALEGLFLTDHPNKQPGKHEIAPLSFISGDGLAVFVADEDLDAGSDHLSFRLSAQHEMIGLYDAELNEIDKVVYYLQTTDVSLGRLPSDDASRVFFRLPTPGMANTETAAADTVRLAAVDDVWAYDDSGSDLGTQWRDPTFDDSSWSTGAGVLAYETGTLPAPINTELATGLITHYFRKHFTFDGDPQGVTLELSPLIDDAAVFYLNGAELYRLRMGEEDVLFDTLAAASVGNTVFDGPFTIPADALLQGDNVLAVEVHQHRIGSSDVVFALTLDASLPAQVDQTIRNGWELLDGLRISELMYHPADEGDLEFVELVNAGHTALQLGGVRFTNGIDFTFPEMLLGPSQYVVVARDLPAFSSHYGSGANVAGQYSGNLSDAGENLTLKLAAPLEAAVLRFEFDDAWYPSTDGGGFALAMRDVDGRPADWRQGKNWQAGTLAEGSPGTADGDVLADGVVINEVLSHTDHPLVDSIELLNTGDGPIDLGGWYLSDSDVDLTKFRIPHGTVLEAGQYLVFDETDFNPTPLTPGADHFALDGAHGDDVWLVEGDAAGNVIRVVDQVEFGAAAAGESFGRWPDPQGDLYPMAARTLGSANSGPRVGPLIISEVHYNPADAPDVEDLEYIEIYNPATQAVQLDHWRIRKGIDFDFAAGTTIAPQSTLLVLPFDPHDLGNADQLSTFVDRYQIDAEAAMVGGYSGRPSNGGDTVQLQRPDQPPPDEQTFIPHLLEDEIHYDDNDPWPTGPDGDGYALHRRQIDLWGNDPDSWVSASPTPGSIDLATVTAVAGRYVFYNNSIFDAATDGEAVAPGKEALLPGGTATFANYTSYVRGINGVMVDVVSLAGTPTADDFQFKVGNDDQPDAWPAAPAPQSIDVVAGGGNHGSDRIVLTWADNAIADAWLQVTVRATAATGLPKDDVFYFGNAIGETGNSLVDAKVSSADEIAVRGNQRLLQLATIGDAYDFNRDRRVSAVDQVIARHHTALFEALRLISAPPSGTVSAEAEQLTVGPRDVSLAELDWLDELARDSGEVNSPEKDPSTEGAIDEVLAGLWP